jgi:hypothetical protein
MRHPVHAGTAVFHHGGIDAGGGGWAASVCTCARQGLQGLASVGAGVVRQDHAQVSAAYQSSCAHRSASLHKPAMADNDGLSGERIAWEAGKK